MDEVWTSIAITIVDHLYGILSDKYLICWYAQLKECLLISGPPFDNNSFNLESSRRRPLSAITRDGALFNKVLGKIVPNPEKRWAIVDRAHRLGHAGFHATCDNYNSEPGQCTLSDCETSFE
jgi:hypothetical protein